MVCKVYIKYIDNGTVDSQRIVFMKKQMKTIEMIKKERSLKIMKTIEMMTLNYNKH